MSEKDRQADFDELAAIVEYDEGLPRHEAERLAREQAGERRLGDKMPTVSNLPATVPPALAPQSTPEPVRFVQPPVVYGPGVTRTPPAVEVSALEYDAHLDDMIAAAGAGTVEAAVLSHKKRKGICVRRGDGIIYTRGRH